MSPNLQVDVDVKMFRFKRENSEGSDLGKNGSTNYNKDDAVADKKGLVQKES